MSSIHDIFRMHQNHVLMNGLKVLLYGWVYEKHEIWVQIFKNGPNKVLNVVFHKFYSVHFWILCPICKCEIFLTCIIWKHDYTTVTFLVLSNTLLVIDYLITHFIFPLFSTYCHFYCYAVTKFLAVKNKLILIRPV